jgi:hypothetical protein
MRLSCQNDRLVVETDTYTLLMVGPCITELRARNGQVLVSQNAADALPALELVDYEGHCLPIGVAAIEETRVVPLGEYAAQVFIAGWQADAVVGVALDPASGELLISPSLATQRQGVAAVRWNIGGIARELSLVAPLWQGCRLALDDPLIAAHDYAYPFPWEAGLAILQGAEAGFSVCCHDGRFRYKTLCVGHGAEAHALGFRSDNYGTGYDCQAAGNLTWRLSVHGTDWHEPAQRYRDWLWSAYPLREASARLASWKDEISLAVSWCPMDGDLLEALQEVNPPRRTLLHIPNWREDSYDDNYPRYVASPAGKRFVQKAIAMGFRVAPHFNHFGVDPAHPALGVTSPFWHRQAHGDIMGWGMGRYDPQDLHEGPYDAFIPHLSWGAPFHRLPTPDELATWSSPLGPWQGVPQGGTLMQRHPQQFKRLTCTHTGLPWWRAYFLAQVKAAMDDLGLEAILADQLLVTPNSRNCLVANMTPLEGTYALAEELSQLGAGLAVIGEGRNELTMQVQTIGQAHLFKSHFANVEGLERTPCALNEVLFAGLSRTMGYCWLDGKSEESALKMRVHEALGAIPTITSMTAAEIRHPNPAIAHELERARDQ